MNQRQVRAITRQECAHHILDIHYAQRWPSISFAFGLFYGRELEGICTFGTPPSATLRRGIAGDQFASSILELNRLCLTHNNRNDASYLISQSIKLLGGDKIIISFADSSKNHKGVVYQATNFTYHGLSAKRTDWAVKGKEHLHGQTIADEFRGRPHRSKLMREKYGDDFYLKPRPRKHRYIFIRGSKGFKVKAKRALKYPRMDYPNGI